MSMGKSVMAAAVVAVVVFASGAFSIAGVHDESIAHFEFGLENPASLSITCSTSGSLGIVHVETNTCNVVGIHWSDFTRAEKNCKGGILGEANNGGFVHLDTVKAKLAGPNFYDRPCNPGSPQGNGLVWNLTHNGGPQGTGYDGLAWRRWMVESHNGGYDIEFGVIAEDEFECDDDAGYYKAKADVYVSIVPSRDVAIAAAVCLGHVNN